jgi:hypothetical protein
MVERSDLGDAGINSGQCLEHWQHDGNLSGRHDGDPSRTLRSGETRWRFRLAALNSHYYPDADASHTLQLYHRPDQWLSILCPTLRHDQRRPSGCHAGLFPLFIPKCFPVFPDGLCVRHGLDIVPAHPSGDGHPPPFGQKVGALSWIVPRHRGRRGGGRARREFIYHREHGVSDFLKFQNIGAVFSGGYKDARFLGAGGLIPYPGGRFFRQTHFQALRARLRSVVPPGRGFGYRRVAAILPDFKLRLRFALSYSLENSSCVRSLADGRLVS